VEVIEHPPVDRFDGSAVNMSVVDAEGTAMLQFWCTAERA